MKRRCVAGVRLLGAISLAAAVTRARVAAAQPTTAPPAPPPTNAQPAEPPPPKNDDVPKAPPNVSPEVEIGDDYDEGQRTQEPGAQSPARPDVGAASDPPRKVDESDPDKKFTVSGWVEGFYQWNFNRPGNGISTYRGYDTRHNSITVQNAVIDVGFRAHDLLARVALQIGHGPAAIYAAEPDLAGAEGANESNAQLWRYLQRASLGWQPTKTFLLELGIFPSTTGVETIAVKDNWNWSRSTASVLLPNYHAGVRASYNVGDRVDIFTALINGWDTITDDNDEKSVIAGVHYRLKEKLTVSGSYFGGVERSAGAPEGRAWRHGIETWAQLDATKWLSVAADSSAGFEDTKFGKAWWTSVAAYVRVRYAKWLFTAFRFDRTWEDTAANGLGESEAILIPMKHVTSLTGTFDVRPVNGLSFRLEYRHDEAHRPLYFRGDTLEGNGSAEAPYVPNARFQNTALLGATAWF